MNAYGESIGCTYLRELVQFGDLTKESLAATWDHPLHRQLRSGAVERSCVGCSGSQGSDGGCRATAFAFHGRWSAPDPFDVTLNAGVDLRELPHWMLGEKPEPPHQAGA